MRTRPALIVCLSLLAAAPTVAVAGECRVETTACIRTMAEQVKHRGWIGIEFKGADPVITLVVQGSPAAAAGVRVGDRWTGLDDFRFADLSEKEAMKRVKNLLQPGNRVVFHVIREGRPLDLDLVPIALPKHILAQWVGQHVLEYHLEPAPDQEVAERSGEHPADG